MTRGLPKEDSPYAAKGTLEHKLSCICLSEDREAREFLGLRENGFQVTPEMVHGIQLYVDLCRHYMDACDRFWIEQPFTLEKLNPPTAMYGTTDFTAWSRKRRELHVIDFKSGKGVWVPAKGNVQAQYYALGAACAIDEPVSRVSMTIVQPHFTNADPIRTWSIDAIELAEFSMTLMERARAAMEPNAPTIAGDHCKFCSAKNSCLSYQNARSEAAFHAFDLADARAAGA